MGMDLTQADKVLKIFYLPPVREMLNSSTILLSRLEKDSSTQDVSGKTFTVPLHIGQNEAAGVGRAEGGTLPTAGAQSYGEAKVPNKYLYGSIEISGPVIAATRNSAGAFIKAIESEMKGCMKNTKRAINRQLHGDGHDALGFYVSTKAGRTVYMDDGNGNFFTHLTPGTTTVDLIDASDNSTELLSDEKVTLGPEGTSGIEVTFTSAIPGTIAAGDYIVPANTHGYQMMGLAGIVSAADPGILGAAGLHGLPVATNPWWAAQVVGSDASKVDLSIPNMQKVFSKIASSTDYSEADIKLILTSYGVRDKYVELCSNERRFYNTMTLDGGFEAVDYNGKPIVPDAQCKKNRMYFLVLDSLKLFRSADFSWMDRDGAILARVPNKDAYGATLFHYGDLGCVCRNANGVLLGINE
mgnify:CR=1 FL=1